MFFAYWYSVWIFCGKDSFFGCIFPGFKLCQECNECAGSIWPCGYFLCKWNNKFLVKLNRVGFKCRFLFSRISHGRFTILGSISTGKSHCNLCIKQMKSHLLGSCTKIACWKKIQPIRNNAVSKNLMNYVFYTFSVFNNVFVLKT